MVQFLWYMVFMIHELPMCQKSSVKGMICRVFWYQELSIKGMIHELPMCQESNIKGMIYGVSWCPEH